ncbi:hypothetical protein EVG20_g171 [Dentipellis fragilis]|uniref:Pentacotripeptide-repeat region of PRORP domain-containing protein n=1 Tax=Dentipellis fragilis TaxID=205917 RepID=A0A4Y9ZGC0_9AGAM|nr:hypothetical protein EVG20_g171 [Dentipellis fragilis]
MLICRSQLLRGHLRATTINSVSYAHESLFKLGSPVPRYGRRQVVNKMPSQKASSVGFSLEYPAYALMDGHGEGKTELLHSGEACEKTTDATGEGSRSLSLVDESHKPPAQTDLDVAGDLERVATAARECRSSVELDNLARDILDHTPEPHRSDSIRTLLTLDLPLAPSTFVILFRSLSNHPSVSLTTAARVTSSVLADKHAVADPSILEDLTAVFHHELSQSQGEDGKRRRLTTSVVSTLFNFISALIRARQESHALQIFQCLVDIQHIPQQAVRPSDSSSASFKFVVTAALIRSCLLWSWRPQAVELLLSLLEGQTAADESTVMLCNEVMHALSEFPTSSDLDLCYTLIRRGTLASSGKFPLPQLLQQTYEAARRLDRGDLAVRLYAHTRSPAVTALHMFPPPRSAILPWVLHHLIAKDKNMHLGRQLVKEVVDNMQALLPRDRAQVIGLAAESGYARYARTLWECYSEGRYKALILGNAAVTVRMCSLYRNLIRQQSSNSQSTTRAAEEKPLVSADENNVPLVPDGAETPYLDVEGLGDEPSSHNRTADYLAFSRRMLSAFRRSKEPLAKAKHFDLNALARAHFLLGDTAAGSGVFQMMLDRGDTPDVYDLNVALAAVAEEDPERAMRMVRRMMSKGLMPDSVSIGTVLHHAVARRNMRVVEEAFAIARTQGQQFTLKTLSSLVRASVQLSGDDLVAVRDNLNKALTMIKANSESRYLPTPNMGKFCITHALRAGDPVMAFAFWQLLVKFKMEWRDQQHRALRYRIGAAVDKECQEGGLGSARAGAMLAELRWQR